MSLGGGSSASGSSHVIRRHESVDRGRCWSVAVYVITAVPRHHLDTRLLRCLILLVKPEHEIIYILSSCGPYVKRH